MIQVQRVDVQLQFRVSELKRVFEEMVERNVGFHVPLRLYRDDSDAAHFMMLVPEEEALAAMPDHEYHAFIEHPKHGAFYWEDEGLAFLDFIQEFLGCPVREAWGERDPDEEDYYVSVVVSVEDYMEHLADKIVVAAAKTA